MITMLQEVEPVVGRVYKFVYNNKTRAAIVLENDGEHMYCWDFTREDFRNFLHERINGVVEDVTDYIKKVPQFDVDDLERHEKAGCSVFPNYEEDVLYALNVKE